MGIKTAQSVQCDKCGRDDIHKDGLYEGDPSQAHDDAYLVVIVGPTTYTVCRYNNCHEDVKTALKSLLGEGDTIKGMETHVDA